MELPSNHVGCWQLCPEPGGSERYSSAGWNKMKVRSAHTLHPLSLATMALFRGPVALGHAYRSRIARAPCFTVALSNSRVASCAAAATLSAGSNADRGKARRWDIPWGNPSGQVEGEKIERILEALPGTGDVEGSDCFRVMSFNMLAQSMASSKMFTYVPKGQLRKNVRWPRVRDEISRYGADIICLQECDSFNKILNSLQEQGQSQGTRFEGVLKRRKGNKDGHGVAVFFDSKVFRLLDSDSCDFGRDLFQGVGSFVLLQDRRRQLHKSYAENAEPTNDDAYTVRRENRGDEGEEGEAVAETADQGEASASGLVCVATTHLYWHPDGAAIRLAQAEHFVASVEAFLRQRFGDAFLSVPIVLAGDLNNVPGVDVYTLLSTGACDGGTPKAFMRRRLLRAAARRAEKLEQLREANRASASMSAVKGDNCLRETAKASDFRRSTLEGNTANTSEGATCAETGVVHGISMALRTDEMTGATAIASARATPLPARGSRQSAQNGSDLGQETISDAARTIADAGQIGSENRQSAGGRSTIAPPDGSKDGDVRQYLQGFRGFSSAYGDYSSIFGSQLPDRYPIDQESVCETTGQRMVGHVQLGVRDSRTVNCRIRDNGVEPELEEVSRSEEFVMDRSQGEPQLTTCTDKFAGTIDYIWHTQQLRVRSLLDLPSLEQAMQGGGLPTTSYPSDHLSIMAELQWRRPADDRGVLAGEYRA